MELIRISCMSITEHSTCNRPVQYVFNGSDGPFYRCGKCGNKLIKGRDDIVVIDG